eukprot:scaffold2764_cov57-Attheya_sp.AAC.1
MNQDATKAQGTNVVFVVDLEGDIPDRQSPVKEASVKEDPVDISSLLRLPKGVNTLENAQKRSRQVEPSRSKESETSDPRQVANKSSKGEHDVVARCNPDFETETQSFPAKKNTTIGGAEFLYLDDLVGLFSTSDTGNIDEVNEEKNTTADTKDTDDSILPKDQLNESITATTTCGEQESVSLGGCDTNHCDERNLTSERTVDIDSPLGAQKVEWERSFFDPVADSIVAKSFLNIVKGEDKDKKRHPSKLDSNSRSPFTDKVVQDTEEHQGIKAYNGSQDSEDSEMFVNYGNISFEQESENENIQSPSSVHSLKHGNAATNEEEADPNMLLKSEKEARRNLRETKCRKVEAYRRRRVQRKKGQNHSTCVVGNPELGSKGKDKSQKKELMGSPSIEQGFESPLERERNHMSATQNEIAVQNCPRKDCDSISLPVSQRVNVNGTWDRKRTTTPVNEPCISTGKMYPKADAVALRKSSPKTDRTITTVTLLQADATTTAIKKSFPSQLLTGMPLVSTLPPTADARTPKRDLHSPPSTGRTITYAFPSDTHFSSIVPTFSSQKVKPNQNVLLTSMLPSTALEEKTPTKVKDRIKQENSVVSLSSPSSVASTEKSATIVARPISPFLSPGSSSSSVQRSTPSPASLNQSKYSAVPTRKLGAAIASRISTLTGISPDFDVTIMAPFNSSEASISKTTPYPSKVAVKTLVSSPSSFRKMGDYATPLEAYSTTVKNPRSSLNEQRRVYQEKQTYNGSEGGLTQSPMTSWKENIAPQNKLDTEGRKKNQTTERTKSTMRFQVQNVTTSVSPSSGGKPLQKPIKSPPQNKLYIEGRKKNQTTERSNLTMHFQVQNVTPSVSPRSGRGDRSTQKPIASPPQPQKETLSAAPTKKLAVGIASRISAMNLS